MCLGLGWEAGGLHSPSGAGEALHQRADAVSRYQHFRGKLLNCISLWAVSGYRLLVWLVVFFLPSLEYCTAILYNHSLQALGMLQSWTAWISKLGLWQEVLELQGEYCVSPSFQEAGIVHVVKCAII